MFFIRFHSSIRNRTRIASQPRRQFADGRRTGTEWLPRNLALNNTRNKRRGHYIVARFSFRIIYRYYIILCVIAMVRANYLAVVCILSVSATPMPSTVRLQYDIIVLLSYYYNVIRTPILYAHSPENRLYGPYILLLYAVAFVVISIITIVVVVAIFIVVLKLDCYTGIILYARYNNRTRNILSRL